MEAVDMQRGSSGRYEMLCTTHSLARPRSLSRGYSRGPGPQMTTHLFVD
jgi:hypothetical protein